MLSLTIDGATVLRSGADGLGSQAPSEASIPSYALVDPGELVVNPMWLVGGSIGVATISGAVSPAYRVYQPRQAVDPRFLHHAVRSERDRASYRMLGRGETTFDRAVSADEFEALPIAWPDLEEQRRIADFLDDRVARIDCIVAARHQQIALIADLEQTELTRCLTRSTDQLAELRRLGVGVTTGPFGTVFAATDYVTGGIPMINPTHIKNGLVRPDDQHSVSVETAIRLDRHRLRAGDLVVSRKGDIGRTAMIQPEQDGWVCGSDSIALHTSGSRVQAAMLDLLLKLDSTRDQLLAQSNAATMPSLNEGNLLSLRVPVVCEMEQQSRVKAASTIRLGASQAMADIKRGAGLLDEYKRSLITAAVTGELDVTTASTEISG